MKELVISQPNAKQEMFFNCHKRFVGYGGARGGGKSWALRTKFVLLALEYSGLKLLILRKTLPELRENHLLPLLAQLNGIARYKRDERAFIFPNGSRIRLGYCDSENDIYQYQGQEYDVIGVEECTHFLKSTAALAVYCECEFHDTKEGSDFIINNTVGIGEAIAKGICKYYGVKLPAEKNNASSTDETLYAVQTGAFSKKENAQKHLQALKKAGFEGFIIIKS